MATTVYLLHFSRPYKHARHYLGFTKASLDGRIAEHNAGHGARLTAVARAAGIDLILARVWKGETRTFERSLKNTKAVPRLCPLCRAAANKIPLPEIGTGAPLT